MRRLVGICIAVFAFGSIAAGAHAQDGFDPNGQCVGDADGDGTVAINEIITAVNNALNGCGFVPVTLNFRATVGDETFACGNVYHNVGTTKGDIVPSDFRFYIYNVRPQGSGALTIDPVPQIPTYFSACIGGSDANCTGGTNIYIGSDPGFKEADATEETPTLFALPDGVTVGVEVVSIDPALSLKFDTGTLNAAGQSLEFGTTPGIHADLEWQLALPGGTPFATGYPVTLKLTTTSSGFTDSAEFTEIVRPSSGTAPPAD